MPDVKFQFTRFAKDDRGGIAIIFALSAMVFFLSAGLAIDAGRAYNASSKVQGAIDAAALTAAKQMRDGNLTDSEVEAAARRLFDRQIVASGGSLVNVSDFTVVVDQANGSVEVKFEGNVTATIGRIAGFNTIDIPATSLAVFRPKNIELGMSLDMTGSMRGAKMIALKAATHDLIDIMLPDNGPANDVRIAFAPYAAGVNAGDYAADVSNGRASDGCVYERLGRNKTSLEVPSIGGYLAVRQDFSRASRCPGSAKVLPLTNDKELLRRNVDNFSTGGSTAGHLGTAWAGYLLSPEWSAIFPSESEPAAMGDKNTIKAVILMTDGEYNTYGGRWGGGRQSGVDARGLCSEIKKQKTVVYAIGFELRNRSAISILKACASSSVHFFEAKNGAELRDAFRSIATSLSNLRLAR